LYQKPIAMKSLAIIILIFPIFNAYTQLKTFQIFAHSTDSNIKLDTLTRQGNLDSLFHHVYLNPSSQLKERLFVFFPGTNADPSFYQRIDSLAANLGYHVIGLNYVNVLSISNLCGDTSDENCSENARKEILYGNDLHSEIDVNQANSAINRLLKLLIYLHKINPEGSWNSFLNATQTEVIWEKTVVAGHSQGGGHAALIAQDNRVNRVLFFNSPSDNNKFYDDQPPWFYRKNATPDSCYYAFYHEQNGGDSRLEVYKNFGLGRYGDVVNVDVNEPPYDFSHVLMTDISTFPENDYTNTDCFGGGADTAYDPHNDIIVDCEVPVDINNYTPYELAWEHMLTNEVSNATITALNENDLKLNVYPNPTENHLLISNEILFDKLEVFDSQGKIRLVEITDNMVNLSTLSKGVYFLKIYSLSGKWQIERFLKR